MNRPPYQCHLIPLLLPTRKVPAWRPKPLGPTSAAKSRPGGRAGVTVTGHPIATIYFPSAARNTSREEGGRSRRRSRVNK